MMFKHLTFSLGLGAIALTLSGQRWPKSISE
jgi:hypothetical protein